MKWKFALMLGLVIVASSHHGLAASGTSLDGFENPAPWGSYNADGAILKVDSAPGVRNKALEMKYALKAPGQWVAISKETAVENPTGKTVKFQIKSKGAKDQTLEVKFVDEDGSIFGYKMPVPTNDKFTSVSVPFSNFTYWWGGDANLGKVTKFEYAVSGEPGEGIVVLDELELAQK